MTLFIAPPSTPSETRLKNLRTSLSSRLESLQKNNMTLVDSKGWQEDQFLLRLSNQSHTTASTLLQCPPCHCSHSGHLVHLTINVGKDQSQMQEEIRNSTVLHSEKEEEAAVDVYFDAETCSSYWLSHRSQDYVTF